MKSKKQNKCRFNIIINELMGEKSGCKIIEDTETGVNYLYHYDEFGGGLTKLIDGEGEPLISPKNWIEWYDRKGWFVKKDWYVFNDNFGTSEEKAFVKYFNNYTDELKVKYSKVYMVRNERKLKIYSFTDGKRFEADYLVFLKKDNVDGYEQMQIFMEPKGTHLLNDDHWKEAFLLVLEQDAKPVKKFKDDNEYKIWGFHFFNRENRENRKKQDWFLFSTLLLNLKLIHNRGAGIF